jgi:tetratricopeptide (TPR) repeat protein
MVLIGCAGCALDNEELADRYCADALNRYEKGDYLAARESYEAALKIRPEDPALLYDAGESCARLGATAQAERYYNECLQKDPNHAPARGALVKLMVRSGRRNDAAQMVDDWLKREPKRADAYALDGWLYHQAGDLPNARGRLEQALEFDPLNVRALTELGLIYEEMNRPDRAVVLYEQVLVRDPNQSEVTRRLNALLAKGAGRPQPE